ncbi:glutamic acid-rich protein isoform X2 [Halyomorpha halys]|uniref:glutamic acid-rich protein isoform X2 n=1 Tax=Halyomorpha halys TaxID=286706 RepID=UPI0006D5290F|nr:uncharacterized protein LOC106684351 isoform X2 [Halyomorpha halys]
MDEIGITNSCIFIKEEKGDEVEAKSMNDPGVFVEEEKTDEVKAKIPSIFIKQEDESQFYYEGWVAHMEGEGENLVSDDESSNVSVSIKEEKKYEIEVPFPIVKTKQHEESQVYCSGLTHVKQEKEELVSDHGINNPGAFVKEENMDETEPICILDSLHQPQEISECDSKTNMNKDSKTQSIVSSQSKLCPHCDHKADSCSRLKFHVLVCHKDEKPHQCPHCDYKVMTPKKKVTIEERKLQKRIAGRLRYAMLKSDPGTAMEMKIKNQKKKKKRKEEGKEKLISAMTLKEKRAQRRKWRECSRNYRQRKKEKIQDVENNCEHKLDLTDSDNSSDAPGPSALPAEWVDFQISSGERRRNEKRRQLQNENKRLKDENNRLKKKIDCLKKRSERERKKSLKRNSNLLIQK